MSTKDAASSFVYSLSRPLHPMQPQTTQYRRLEEYAYKKDIQALLHDTLSKLFTTQPEDPLAFVIKELQAEKQLRDQVASASVVDATAAAVPNSQNSLMKDSPSADTPSSELPAVGTPNGESLPADPTSDALPAADAPTTEASALSNPLNDALPDTSTGNDHSSS